MSTERSAHFKAPSLAVDLTVAILIFFAATFAFVLMDAFESLYVLSRQYEEWELDDFILAGLALPLSLAWLAWRSQVRAQRHLKARVALEQDLRRSHDKLSILVSAAPGVLYISRPWGDFATTFVSPSVQSEFGYDPSEILSDAYYWTDRLHPEDKDYWLEMHDKVFRQDVQTWEYRILHADGTYRWVRDELKLFRNSDGKPEQIIGFVHDITDRKAFEQRLTDAVKERTAALNESNRALRDEIEKRRSGEERLRQAAELAKIGYYIMDAVEDRCLFCSEEHARIHGLSPEEYIEQVSKLDGEFVLTHPEDRESVREEMVALRQGRPMEIEYRTLLADGSSRYVREIAKPVFDAAGRVAQEIGTSQDITEVKEAQQQLHQALKMEAVGQLTGGVAHDFNNLLTVILGNLQLVERRLKDDERLRRRVEAAIHASRRGAELTHRLLAFSRQQHLEAKIVDLDETLSGMHKLLQTTLGDAVELEIGLAGDLPDTLVDPAQLESAVLNLAINARDAMPNGGRLTIETSQVELDRAGSRSPEIAPGTYVMLSVRDNGQGMSPAVTERIFEPFFTTKESGKGSGLGLSMVFGFIIQSGGQVALESEEGKGTCFKLYLPVAEARELEGAETCAPASPATATAADYPSGAETVLVVEDQEDLRETALALLEDLGYRVLTAESGPRALAVLDRHREVDLLFTDMVMPDGMDGLDLAIEASSRVPDLKVLCTSGYSEKAHLQDETSGRGFEWIGKPYVQKALAQKVRQTLDKPAA